MCGLAGVLRLDRAVTAAGSRAGEGGDPHGIAVQMAAALAHRGPDDAHAWSDADAGIALGFRRLSILDLSREGRQPMVSADGRHVIAFNGEIYNHRDLRRELEREAAVAWRGHSDTEVLLEYLARHGMEAGVERLDGMFAIALWDRRERALWLARDRFGEKPLYYGNLGGDLAFASELPALARHPGWSGEPDREALARFVRLGYVPSPCSAFRGIAKLPAGHLLRLGARAADVAPACYWSPWTAAEAAGADPFRGSEAEAIEALGSLVDRAVARRVVADRPLGAFLSGGIDSSTVVGAMTHAGGDVRTFSIGFDDPRFDESPHAEAVAAHLGTRHTSMRISGDDCLEVVPELPRIYDEPFADASQIPTVLLCRLTGEHVTVSLSGDGGDELFGGYPRYRDTPPRWERVRRAPAWARGAAGAALAMAGSRAGRWPRKIRRSLGDYAHRHREDLFLARVSHWSSAEGLVFDRTPADAPRQGQALDTARAFMVSDAAGYLADDLQVKVDRASMRVGLEVRAPLLDHHIAEFAWRLPAALTSDAPGKRALRELLYRRVPRELVDRPKQGFEPPIGDWLRGPLREQAEHHFSPAALARHGLVDPDHVAFRWREHLGGRNRAHALWIVFSLGAWLDGAPTLEASVGD